MANTNPIPSPLLPSLIKGPMQQREAQELRMALQLMLEKIKELEERLQALESA